MLEQFGVTVTPKLVQIRHQPVLNVSAQKIAVTACAARCRP
jgi:hypothetical protein